MNKNLALFLLVLFGFSTTLVACGGGETAFTDAPADAPSASAPGDDELEPEPYNPPVVQEPFPQPSVSQSPSPIERQDASPTPVAGYEEGMAPEAQEPPPPPPSVPSPEFTEEPDEELDAASIIRRRLERLPLGEVYHNIPQEMQVGKAEIIEAGVAPEITEKIRQEAQGQGEITTFSGVRFNPSGVNMELVASPDVFDVLEVRGGEQFVTSELPGKWIWQVRPLKPGEHLIVVKAKLDLNVPELGVTRPVEVEVFRDARNVKANWGYSLRGFLTANWKELLGLTVGSGSVAGLVGWSLNRRGEKTKAKD
ncbi:hypothetical protein [Egbenema bharatensis]|uniref:hypothetical protein n=1 Tax=Egbenema bharatensis TaxID=3463334 RepID=UPI003A8A3A76